MQTDPGALPAAGDRSLADAERRRVRRDLTIFGGVLFAVIAVIAVERRMEKLAEERKKGGGREKAVVERELALFERFHKTLSNDQPLRELEVTSEDEKFISSFGFLTRKPLLVTNFYCRAHVHEGYA